MTESELTKGFQALSAAGLFEYDLETETLLDLKALLYNPLKNGADKDGNPKPDRRIVGAVKQLRQVEDSPLFRRFLQLAETFSPDLAGAVRAELPTWITNAGGSEGASKGLRRGFEGGSREE